MDLSLLSALIAGFTQVFAWPTFGYLLIGVGLGFAVGILPGLGGPVALALMLPFTFDMEPVQAFAFLLGMLSVTATTGDLTSILFGVPGEATSAALVVDGHAMAKRGEAGRALGAALASSVVGAVLGAFVLALSIPIVRPLVLSFGAPEFFMLTVLGLTFVASLSSGAVLKGLIAGGLGLMLSMVGLDPQTSTQRYTFGLLHLWDGVGLVPVAIGIFAIPEIVDLARKGTSIAGANVGRVGGVLEGVNDTFRHFWLTLRCSMVGSFLGLIPGLGGSVAQWIAYAHAAQTARDREAVGRGAIEGVLGPGAANNAKEGGSLIPTIAFGVPSGVSMAILLGAFLIQGLTPGPSMLTTNLPLTMSFVWMIVVSNIIVVAICLLLIRQIAQLTLVRAGILLPPIILLVYVGAFAEKNTLFDLLTVLAFGGLGLLFVQFDWPRPPLVLGLVLGRLAENYLFLSIARYETAFLTRPLVLLLAALCVAAVLLPLLQPLLGRYLMQALRSARAVPAFASDDS